MSAARGVEVRLGEEPAGRSGAETLAAPTAAELRGEAAAKGLAAEAITDGGGLAACVGCAHPELYTQKDFPRAAGIAIVVVAAVLAPATHYASLAAAALVDLALYRLAPDVVRCYVCGTEHRRFARSPRHPAFDREIDERLRYGRKAVMGKPMREGGTADAPEPEH